MIILVNASNVNRTTFLSINVLALFLKLDN